MAYTKKPLFGAFLVQISSRLRDKSYRKVLKSERANKVKKDCFPANLTQKSQKSVKNRRDDNSNRVTNHIGKNTGDDNDNNNRGVIRHLNKVDLEK